MNTALPMNPADETYTYDPRYGFFTRKTQELYAPRAKVVKPPVGTAPAPTPTPIKYDRARFDPAEAITLWTTSPASHKRSYPTPLESSTGESPTALAEHIKTLAAGRTIKKIRLLPVANVFSKGNWMGHAILTGVRHDVQATYIRVPLCMVLDDATKITPGREHTTGDLINRAIAYTVLPYVYAGGKRFAAVDLAKVTSPIPTADIDIHHHPYGPQAIDRRFVTVRPDKNPGEATMYFSFYLGTMTAANLNEMISFTKTKTDKTIAGGVCRKYIGYELFGADGVSMSTKLASRGETVNEDRFTLYPISAELENVLRRAVGTLVEDIDPKTGKKISLVNSIVTNVTSYAYHAETIFGGSRGGR